MPNPHCSFQDIRSRPLHHMIWPIASSLRILRTIRTLSKRQVTTLAGFPVYLGKTLYIFIVLRGRVISSDMPLPCPRTTILDGLIPHTSKPITESWHRIMVIPNVLNAILQWKAGLKSKFLCSSSEQNEEVGNLRNATILFQVITKNLDTCRRVKICPRKECIYIGWFLTPFSGYTKFFLSVIVNRKTVRI